MCGRQILTDAALDKLALEFIEGRASLRELAERSGLKHQTLKQHAAGKQWGQRKAEYREKLLNKPILDLSPVPQGSRPPFNATGLPVTLLPVRRTQTGRCSAPISSWGRQRSIMGDCKNSKR